MCRENLVAGKFLRYSKTLHVTSTLVFLWYNDGYEYLSTFSTASTKRSISGSWQKLSTLSWKLVSSRSWMASVACVAPASLPLRSLNIRYVKKLHLARVISSSPQVPQGRPCKQEINELSPVTSHAFTTIYPSWNISKQSAACVKIRARNNTVRPFKFWVLRSFDYRSYIQYPLYFFSALKSISTNFD